VTWLRAKSPDLIPPELEGWGLFRVVGELQELNAYLIAQTLPDGQMPVIECRLVGIGYFESLSSRYEAVESASKAESSGSG